MVNRYFFQFFSDRKMYHTDFGYVALCLHLIYQGSKIQKLHLNEQFFLGLTKAELFQIFERILDTI